MGDNENNNRVQGSLYLENSEVNFVGKNNILYILGNVSMFDSSIEFRGDNSIVYICETKDVITLNLKVYNNSVFYMAYEIYTNKGINSSQHLY